MCIRDRFNAGEGYMSVLGIDEYEGNPVYRVNLGITGGIGPARVNDMYQTWFDVTTLQTWRYIRDIDEVGYKSYRHWQFFPDIMRCERIDGHVVRRKERGDLSLSYVVQGTERINEDVTFRTPVLSHDRRGRGDEHR